MGQMKYFRFNYAFVNRTHNGIPNCVIRVGGIAGIFCLFASLKFRANFVAVGERSLFKGPGSRFGRKSDLWFLLLASSSTGAFHNAVDAREQPQSEISGGQGVQKLTFVWTWQTDDSKSKFCLTAWVFINGCQLIWHYSLWATSPNIPLACWKSIPWPFVLAAYKCNHHHTSSWPTRRVSRNPC